uniref:SH3 domain-containing protein n=2 Tax=Meloidogyne TaxID=189290 RepID=A0A914MK51_MELIC
MTFSSTATISSYGCSDAGKTREGRIYATAGFGAAAAARNRKKKLKNNNGIIENKNNEIYEEENVKMRQEGPQTCLVNGNNQLNVSNLTNNKNDLNSFGTLKSNSGASIGAFSLGNEFIYETTGKSTLGRRAQKLAQRAALKLSKSGGTLSAELSSSASAIYALFSGNNSNNNNGFVNEKCLNGENIRPGSDDFLLSGRKKGSKIKGRKKLEVISSTGCYWMDKTTLVSKHTAKGIDFLDSFGLFIKERAQIEEEYANKLKNLSKKSRGKKASDDEFTSSSAFHAVLGELESLASQHELVVECLRDVLLPKINDKCRQFRTVRKKHSQNFELMEKDYNAKVDELQKQKKNYEKAHIEAQNAHIKHKRAFENRYLSRHEVDKAQLAANNKSTICEQGKQNYASQLAATNQAKSDFYNILLPRLLEEMRQLEIERIDFTREIMLESVKAETDVLHIKQRCYEDMNNAIKTVNPEHDTLLVVEQTKTGYTHPADFEFEDFGDPAKLSEDDNTSFDSSTIRRIGGKNINGKGIPRKHSLKLFNNSIGNKSNGNTSTGSSHTSSGSNIGEYGSLPPQQRCRRIQKKLEELTNELSIKENSKEGLERLLSVYSNGGSSNNGGSWGDPQIVEKQIEHNKCEIDALSEQIRRFKNLLSDAQSELNQPLGGGGGAHLNTTTNSTISSSPNSSPRGSACSGGGGGGIGNNNVSRLNGLNGNNHHNVGERGSYSEASSISSADGAGSSLHGGVTTSIVGHSATNGGGTRLLPPPQPSPVQIVPSVSQQNTIQQTSSTISTSGFSSSSAALTPVTSSTNIKNNIADASGGDFYEECDGPVGGIDGTDGGVQHSDMVLGTALARYHYDATPDEAGGTIITMNEGDELLLLERDMGDGWTRVRHRISNAEGFVPTSYLDCKWYGASTSR